MIWTINSRADLETYVENEHPDAGEEDLEGALVDALVLQCPVDYGQDWTEWLEDNAAGYLSELVRARMGDGADDGYGDYLYDQQKDDDLRGDR